MTLEQLSFVFDMVGVVVVVGTLILIWRQVRQGTDVLRSQSRQAQLAYDQDGVYKFVEHPVLAQTFSQEETPDVEEKTRLMFWIIGQMRAREYEYLQHKSGALSEEAWMTYRGVIYFLLGTERSRAFWALTSAYFNPEFVGMVEDMMEGVPVTDYWARLDAIP